MAQASKRAIKFRAWDIRRKEMRGSSYPERYHGQGAYDEMWGDPTMTLLNGIEEINKDTGFAVMQFTGVLDKRGKEIYESDLIRFIGGNESEVYWDRGAWRVRQGDESGSLLGEFDEAQLEVVGNIYERPKR